MREKRGRRARAETVRRIRKEVEREVRGEKGWKDT